MLRTGSKKIVCNAFGGTGPEFSDNPVEQSENARRASTQALKLPSYSEYQGKKRYTTIISKQARDASKKLSGSWSGGFEELTQQKAAETAKDQQSHWDANIYHASAIGHETDHKTAATLHNMAFRAHGSLNARNAKTVEQHKLAEDFHERMANDFGDLKVPLYDWEKESQRHLVAAAHHATAAHVLDRHGYNSSDDAAADREF